MRGYPFLGLFERYGTWLSLGIALAFLTLELVVTQRISLGLTGAALALLSAAVLWLFLRTLSEIVRLLSETLIPRP